MNDAVPVYLNLSQLLHSLINYFVRLAVIHYHAIRLSIHRRAMTIATAIATVIATSIATTASQ